MINNRKPPFKKPTSMAPLLVLILASATSLFSHAKTHIEPHKQLTAYGQALAEHNRVLGTWSLYQGADAVFTQTLLPNKEGTGVVVADDKIVHQYKIGSISKTFTAVLTFKMIEAKKLSLDTSLAKFYPDIANAEAVTIGHMLNHHSGIASYTDHSDFLAYYQKPQSQTQMVARIEALPAAFKPGEKAAYSNSNYLLLGYILEQVSGQSYANLLNTHIIKPLQLKRTFYGSDNQIQGITSYQLVTEQGAAKWQVIPPWSLTTAGAAGAIISTADDLHTFFRGLFNDQLISAQSRKQMTTLQNNYGSGIFQTEFTVKDKEIIGYWHNGGIEGFASHVMYFPSIDMTTVVLSNGLYKSSIDDLNQALIDGYRGVSMDTKIAALTIKAEQLKPYIGYFQSAASPLDIDVSLLDNQLMAQASGQGAFPLTPDGEHRFTFAAANIEVLFKQDYTGFTLNQGANRTDYQRNDDAKPQAAEVDEALLQSYTGVYATDSFPLDITVSLKDGQLQAQATGQGAFPLTAKSTTEFTFSPANITMVFDADKQTMHFSQMNNSFEMQKKTD